MVTENVQGTTKVQLNDRDNTEMSFFPSASQVLHLLQNQIHQYTVNVCCTCCTWFM